MCNPIGRIVRAKAGREKDGYYCVVGVDQEKGYLLLADGKRRHPRTEIEIRAVEI